MSHFSCVVITEFKPTDDDLHRILLPYHEYECTGYKEYTEAIDITDEAKTDYEKYKGDYNNFLNFCEEWYCYDVIDESEAINHIGSMIVVGSNVEVVKVIRFTNPNAKWDWWQIGGRWSGFFEPLYDPEEDPANFEVCFICEGTGMRNDEIGMAQRQVHPEYKCNGCNGDGISLKWPTQWKQNIGNQVMVRDYIINDAINFEAERFGKKYDEVHAVVAGREILVWDEVRNGRDIEEARDIYNNNQVNIDLRQTIDFFTRADEFNCSREEYINRNKARAVAPFAMIDNDGKWFERGEMGWFGAHSEDVDHDVWAQEYVKLINSLPSHYWLTMVDCHI